MKRDETWADGEDGETVEAPMVAAPHAPPAEVRYTDLGGIAMGGMGDVRRVRDHHLGRVVAMKVIRHDRAADLGMRERFYAEILRTASLQHPGIVSVYDWGERPDGRLWFTMPEVVGQTFSQLIAQVHQSADAILQRRLLAYFARVCEAVAYAHSRGVVHRDLKPDNLMVGVFGEVLVMDLGLARRVGEAMPDAAGEVDIWESGTSHGQVLGTPAYLPPEQALGEAARLGPPSDVYALGAVLYEILAGVSPYGCSGRAALQAVLAGPPPPLSSHDPTALGAIPADLMAICGRAMARDPEDRYPDAGALADELNTWLDGARRREQALVLVAEAHALEQRQDALQQQARALWAQAARLLADVAPHDPVDRKLPGWTCEDEARRLEDEAVLLETQRVEALQSALRVLPELEEARAPLADCYRARVVAAEQRHDRAERTRAEAQLRSYDRGRYRAFLQNEGRLTLHTDPPGAVAHLYAYQPQERRLQQVFVRTLGRTPLREVVLPGGSYLIRLEAPGRLPVDYPVLIEREQHWDGLDPDGTCVSIHLPPVGAVDPATEVYIPAGWFTCGGDPDAPDSLPRQRVWVDGLCMARLPVTNADYLAFLNARAALGADVSALLPSQHAGSSGTSSQEAPVYLRTAEGRYVLPHTADVAGQTWQLDWPVVLVTWDMARAYADWRAALAGQPLRLPDELEFEKAARGVDGRIFPWGDFGDPTWAHVLGSRPGPPSITRVGAYPTDQSPLGVRDYAGNVREWCGNTWLRDGPRLAGGRLLLADHAPGEVAYRAVRGGAWSSQLRLSRAAGRFASPPGQRLGTLGFRLARSYPIERS